MNNYIKFFLGFLFLVALIDLMLIDRKKTESNMINLFATFNQIDGLNNGANVMVSGINVGFVESIILEKNYPKISMLIDKNLKITSDSSISIQTDGLFGSKFLVIELGGDEEFLYEGDSFSYTEDSILLQDLLENIIKIGESKKL
jgi:phospholipid/cholesterol/gamma-HCH transport system substrate-binding protein|tara:strand:- start:4485 stop:4919 length:435 start_codon:yes stop_codon:yes gene_type:complete